MGAVPGNLETEKQPPMTVPLRHFLVGIGFLLTGAAVGTARVAGIAPALARVSHVHLLLAGWVCVTIMGAMTQFVPVWSGVTLQSRRLAVAQLWLVTVGLAGFSGGFLLGEPWLVAPFGATVLAGFWTFAYNFGRTAAAVDEFDVTEAHFAVALGWFVFLTVLGLVLAVDLSRSVLPAWEISRTRVDRCPRDPRGLRCGADERVRRALPASDDVHPDGTPWDRRTRRRDPRRYSKRGTERRPCGSLAGPFPFLHPRTPSSAPVFEDQSPSRTVSFSNRSVAVSRPSTFSTSAVVHR